MRYLVIAFLLWIAGIELQAQPPKTELLDWSTIRVTPLPINTAQSDFGPTLIGKSIYFSAYRDAVISLSEQEVKNKEFYDLFRAGVDDSGQVTSKREAVEEFISRYHDGPASWCPATGELFLTQSNYVDPETEYVPFRKDKINLRLIIAHQVDGKWKKIEELPFNNSRYSVGHPAINSTGDTLYFSSDMPGGYGLTDLYYSVRKGHKWGKPINLGGEINTEAKEEFPFLTGHGYPGRSLIFASTGHGSKGGFDLFYKRLDEPQSKVVPLPEPLNSPFDDFALILPDDAEYGYFTSNRPGTGDDDLYRFSFKREMDYRQEIVVLDDHSKKQIEGALVHFCDQTQQTTDQNGLVAIKLKRNSSCEVLASAFGYQDNHKLVTVGFPKPGELLRDTILLHLMVKEKIVLRNIYYDFDKWNILPESSVELDRLVNLMKQNPDLLVELGSHTDERGTDEYNLRLSQRRAQSAVNYILAKGIDKSRIKAIGYGETQLIHKSTKSHKCTPEEHRENRRTEIYIPGYLKGEPVKQTKGDYSGLINLEVNPTNTL